MTAKDFLLKYLNYKCFWISHHVLNDKPSTIRLQQIEALLDAFDLSKKSVDPSIQIKYKIITTTEGDLGLEMDRASYLSRFSDLEYFEKGEFLHDRPYEDYQELA